MTLLMAAGSCGGAGPATGVPPTGPAVLPPGSPGAIASTRTGLATLRSRSVLTCSSDQFRPTANVAAATPTTSAPRVIDARAGRARPADAPRRPGSPSGSARPSRRRRPPSVRRDGAVPRVIASTALIRPARVAGRSAASRDVARATASTVATTGRERVKADGSPKDSAVSWMTGWLAIVPRTTPISEPSDRGREHLAREDRADLAGRVAHGLHDPDIAVARQDDAGHDVGDQEGRGQHREDREGEQHGHVEVGDPVDADLEAEPGLGAADGVRRQAPRDRHRGCGEVRSRRRGRHAVQHLLLRRAVGEDGRQVRRGHPDRDARRADGAGDADDDEARAPARPRARTRPPRASSRTRTHGW